MSPILPIELCTWGGEIPQATQVAATDALEAGSVLFFPNLSFELTETERAFLSPEIVGSSKNVNYDPKSGKVGGANVAAMKLHELRGLMDRFATATRELLSTLLPTYRNGLHQARTSLRPVEVAGRKQTWRKDDTRLHVDSFPSQPSRGKRILRVFCNVNPDGRPRVWKVGEQFDTVARKYWPALRAPLPGERGLLAAIRVTKSVRTRYDHYMLKLHDAMKLDPVYQARFASATHLFPAGSSWVCFTDQVSHAAVSGAHQLEQTFMVDVNALRNPASAPLRVLESLAGRKLA
ncbi:MAG: Kdo hydroxylase family protein [Planctomycetia bacterium]|nr:Kdo hydroxylase family protein [Planctomycetia bacterium]